MKATAAGALRSKTIWVAIALAVTSTIAAGLPDLQPYVGKWGPLIGQGLAVVIAILRILTTLPLDEKTPPREPPHDDGTASDQ